ncbi:hypothetical protein [Aeromonas salmonicida]|uniref:hypothetical protein n=1 Tax=Aeromonas salmonicida TaxID=645 RepID=UPI000B3FBA66
MLLFLDNPEPVPVICFTRAASGRSAAVPGQPEPVPVICGQLPDTCCTWTTRASTGDLLHQGGQLPERCCSWTTRAGAGDLRPAASGRIPAAPGQPEPVPVICFTRAASCRSAAVPGQPRTGAGDLLHIKAGL